LYAGAKVAILQAPVVNGYSFSSGKCRRQKSYEGKKMLLRHGLVTVFAAALVAVGSPALADPKAGFDLWNRGDY
jgi:hypothetical protein